MAIPPALIVGPDAATAALVAAAIVPLAAAPDERVRLASALALLVAGLTAVGGGGLPWDVDTGGTQCRADGTELARPTGALRDLLRAYGLGELTPTADLARRDLAASVDEVGPTTTETSAGDGVGPDGLDGVDVDPRSGLLSAPGTPEPKPTRRLSLGVVLLGTLVIVVLALAIGLRGGPGSAADQITTPNLIGLTYARARSTADGAGLVLGEPLIIQSAAMAEGTVVAQDPESGDGRIARDRHHPDGLDRARPRHRPGRYRPQGIGRDRPAHHQRPSRRQHPDGRRRHHFERLRPRDGARGGPVGRPGHVGGARRVQGTAAERDGGRFARALTRPQVVAGNDGPQAR